VYYAVVPKGEDPPDYSDYELLDGSVEAGDQRETINLDDAGGDYDVYVIVYKDGEVSDPIIINTKEGPGGVDWIWGEEPMVAIPGGTFLMGGTPPWERTQHSVTVGNFYMGKYEVSQGEYALYKPEHVSYFTGDKLPVEWVSWYDAVGYCNWLSGQEGLAPAYTINGNKVTWDKGANGYRLPTEAEWEYACRAGTTTPFSTGENITTEQANYNGSGTTVEVDSFDANAFGLYNMHGNVFEWCWDWYDDYPEGEETNPAGPDTGADRVVRGGGLDNGAQNLRSAVRSYGAPSAQYSDAGFRLARGPIAGF
jgi:formylglycine-generating enzyme required for sulfatase activity